MPKKSKKTKWLPVQDFRDYFPGPVKLYRSTGHVIHRCLPDEPCRCLVGTDVTEKRIEPQNFIDFYVEKQPR